jgi:hypothetical protein
MYFNLVRKTLRYLRNEIRFSKQEAIHRFNLKSLKEFNNRAQRFKWGVEQIFTHDATTETEFDRHYIYHPAWAMRIVKDINPSVHYDISSTLTFCTMLSAFIPVKFFDYRPAVLSLTGLETDFIDLTNLKFEDNSIHSLSCMHTVEHIGLGRYGDDIDYDGDIRAIKELSRVLAYDGNLLFVVPIGNEPQIQFNAHRIYSKEMIVDTFKSFGLTLNEFTLIPESSLDGGLVKNPSDQLLFRQGYGCGCFWLKKYKQ